MSPAIVLDSSADQAVPVETLTRTADETAHITIKAPLPNPSLQVTADHRLKQQEAPVYAPRKGEVLLHIKATGVCGYGEQIALRLALLIQSCQV